MPTFFIYAVEETEYMKKVGIDVVVTDHHRCQDVIPSAVAVVNPKRPDDTYPFKELAGVGVVFKLLTALEFAVQEKKIFGRFFTELSPEERCKRLIESGESNFLEPVCDKYIDLVAIGTIADVMALTDENRLICAAGLSKIEHSAGMGIEALIDLATDRKNQKFPKKRKINSTFIGYTVAPRINAAGRVADARLGVELFTCSDRADAERVAAALCELNVSRQSEENRISEEAMSLAERTHNFADDPVLVLAGDNWHHGVIGIVSSRITEKYNLPSILISVEDGIGKGSGRSISGLNISDALEACKDVLEKYGGHDLAAGLTVKAENIDELRRRINEYAREHIDLLDNGTKIEIDCEVDSSELTIENADELTMLEPCGTGNPQPIFITRGLCVSNAV
jgi:single-stranded-DNA-specific exonuclease